jgi:muconolactone delta-isomerase
MTTFLATGAISDPSKIGPYRGEEMKILADLQAEGVVERAYRRSQGPGVFLIVNADDLEDAHRHMRGLPFVTQGLLTFDYTPMYEI